MESLAEVLVPLSRPVPAGRTLVLARRTTRRFFILRPDADRKSQRIFYYCLALFAAKHGIVLHALVQMSTHWHVCLTDVRGVLPDFLEDVHQTLAMCLKQHRDWDEEVWNKSQTSLIDIETSTAELKELAYLMCNPIAAGMVKRIEQYPGAITRPEQIGCWTMTLRRPGIGYLSNDAKWPRTVTLSFVLPPRLTAEHGEPGARRAIIAATEDKANELRAARAAKGLGYLGDDAVCSAPITTMATKKEVKGGLKPTFAVGPGERKAFRHKRRQLAAWRAWYADSLERWRGGERDVVWPPYTWKMRVLHGVTCAPPPPPD